RNRLRRLLLLDEAHAAIAGDGEPLVVAEMRHLDAGMLAGLQHRRIGRNLDLDAVDLELRHRPYSAACGAEARYCAIRRSISGRKCRIKPCTGHAAASP